MLQMIHLKGLAHCTRRSWNAYELTPNLLKMGKSEHDNNSECNLYVHEDAGYPVFTQGFALGDVLLCFGLCKLKRQLFRYLKISPNKFCFVLALYRSVCLHWKPSFPKTLPEWLNLCRCGDIIFKNTVPLLAVCLFQTWPKYSDKLVILIADYPYPLLLLLLLQERSFLLFKTLAIHFLTGWVSLSVILS